MVFSRQFTKTAQYHDATNSTHCLFVSWYFPSMSQKRLGTKTLRIPRVISFFLRYFPWKSPKRLGTMMPQITGFIISTFFMLSPIEFIRMAQYHDATNNTRHLIFSQYFPWKSPIRLSTVILQITLFYLHSSSFFPSKSSKRLGTTMLQLTCPISDFSCYCPWILLKRLSTMMLQVTNVFLFLSVYFPYNSQKQLSTMMLQITHAIYFSHDMFHKSHKNGSVPRCYK